MKKRIFIISIISFVVVLISFVLIVFFTNYQDISVTTIKKSYCYVNKCSEKQEFSVDVYITDKNSYITDLELVSNCYLLNDDNQMLEIKTKDIITKDAVLKLEKRKYYLYEFKFEIPFISDKECEFNFKNATVVMEYPEQEVKLNIGSFYYLKVEDYGENNNYLSLSKVRPIVNIINNNKTLMGLNINFMNNSNDIIQIMNVKVLSSNVVIGTSEIIKIEEDIASGDDLSEVLGYRYNPKELNDSNNFELKISKEENVEYLFPLKYLNDYIVDTVGILIEYEYNGIIYKLYYDEILYFQSTNYNLSMKDLDIFTYENN